jgi:predicted esterase
LNDSTQTYALYLPTGFDEKTRWPALLVFDPRGRSVRAARLFEEAAEKYGWIILSSADTRSDETWEPNARALEAMWPEVHERYPVNERRIYAAGFSGGVLVAWYLAQLAKPPSLAGIISVGGRPAPEIPVDRIAFAHFGAAGHLDFNDLAMRALDELVAARGAPHQLRVFEGRHAWMPAHLALEGVEWLEVLAMQQGLRPKEPILSEALFQKNRARARDLHVSGRELDALRRYTMIAETWDGLRNVHSVQRVVVELEQSAAVAEQHKDERRALLFEEHMQDRLSPALDALGQARGPVSAAHYIDALEIHDLKQRAKESSYTGTAAQRVLEWVFTRTSFYIRRDLFAGERFAHATIALRVAAEIHPNNARVWYDLACAHARDHSVSAAVDALHRAIDAGYSNVAHMESDSDLDSIRSSDGYARAVDRLRSAGAAPSR